MKRLLASCFGLGWLPLAPGTWGSLPPMVVFAVMQHFNLPPALICLVMILLVLASSILCVACAPAAITATGKADPPEVVVDEFAGQALTFVIIGAMVSGHNLVSSVGGLLLFRFFDILKPWPIRKLEKLPRGWGVLADDLLASVYAGITLSICLGLWIRW